MSRERKFSMSQKKSRVGILLTLPALAAVAGLLAGGAQRPRAEGPLYLDKTQPLEKRIDDLLGRLTLEEKVGQMNMPCVYVEELGEGVAEKASACLKFAQGTYLEGFAPGGGFFTLPNTILHEGSRRQAEFLNELQRIALEKTRLGIPLLQTEEGTHGLMCSGATIFPEGPALGSAWNTGLISKIY
jgi:beta-glucosidase